MGDFDSPSERRVKELEANLADALRSHETTLAISERETARADAAEQERDAFARAFARYAARIEGTA